MSWPGGGRRGWRRRRGRNAACWPSTPGRCARPPKGRSRVDRRRHKHAVAIPPPSAYHGVSCCSHLKGEGRGQTGRRRMVVTCKSCGGVSRDVEFCDNCNADLMPKSATVSPAVCPLLPEAPLSPQLVQALSRPEASVTVPAGERCWRLHWIATPQWASWRPRVEQRLRCPAAVLPPC